MTEKEKDSYYMEIAQTVAKGSTCFFGNVGCVIVDVEDHIVAADCLQDRSGVLNCREQKYCSYYGRTGDFITGIGDPDCCDYMFPEVNAILSVQRERLKDATIYIYCYDFKADKTKAVKISKTLSKIIRAAEISRIVLSNEEEVS